MNTNAAPSVTTTAPAFREYPNQPVHPVLAEQLYRRTCALQQRWANTDLPLDMDSRMVAAALRLLDRKGRRLWPNQQADLAALVAEALQTLNYCWKRNAQSDYSEQRKAAQTGKPGRARHASLEALCEAGWVPDETAQLYDADDVDAGEEGRFVLSCLRQMGYSAADAQILLRRLISGASWNDLTYERYGPDQDAAVHRRRHEALRKWGKAHLEKAVLRLQCDLSAEEATPPTPEHSCRVSGVRVLRLRKSHHRSAPSLSRHGALPKAEGDQTMQTMHTCTPAFARTDHFCERQAQRQVRDHEIARRAEGTVVIVTPDNALKTTFRNPRFLRCLRRRQH